ncbi:MAG TPA: PadR family transcriptional regulator [Bryobacteraceae bacterium]|nr:PadR family transcriptional regulator [Bryobacteraceae bacterium]
MPKSDKLQGSLEVLILKVLSRRPNIHGYAIITAIRQVSAEVLQVEDGSLYPALHRMEQAGWIRAKWSARDAGDRRRVYELTRAGHKQLAQDEVRWQSVTLAINRVLRMV